MPPASQTLRKTEAKCKTGNLSYYFNELGVVLNLPASTMRSGFLRENAYLQPGAPEIVAQGVEIAALRAGFATQLRLENGFIQPDP